MMPSLAASTKASEVVELKGPPPVIVACENKHKKAGFIAIKAVNNVNFETVKECVSHHLLDNQHVKTDAYPALNIIDKTQQHEPRVTPSER
jgi:hypothetical protein